MFSVKTEVRYPSGLEHRITRALADRVLDACHAFYLQRQGQIPVKTGRLKASLTQRGAADNIAQVAEGPRGPVVEYGTRVPYAQYPKVRNKIPKPTASALIAAARQP